MVLSVHVQLPRKDDGSEEQINGLAEKLLQNRDHWQFRSQVVLSTDEDAVSCTVLYKALEAVALQDPGFEVCHLELLHVPHRLEDQLLMRCLETRLTFAGKVLSLVNRCFVLTINGMPLLECKASIAPYQLNLIKSSFATPLCEYFEQIDCRRLKILKLDTAMITAVPYDLFKTITCLPHLETLTITSTDLDDEFQCGFFARQKHTYLDNQTFASIPPDMSSKPLMVRVDSQTECPAKVLENVHTLNLTDDSLLTLASLPSLPKLSTVITPVHPADIARLHLDKIDPQMFGSIHTLVFSKNPRIGWKDELRAFFIAILIPSNIKHVILQGKLLVVQQRAWKPKPIQLFPPCAPVQAMKRDLFTCLVIVHKLAMPLSQLVKIRLLTAMENAHSQY